MSISRQRFYQLLKKDKKIKENWEKDLKVLELFFEKKRENLKNKYILKLNKIKDIRWKKQKKT